MSCAPGLEYTYNAGVPDEAPQYHCCRCGGTFRATEADIAAAYAKAADAEGARGMALSDTAAFRDYGRDLCDEHAQQLARALRPVTSEKMFAGVEANERRMRELAERDERRERTRRPRSAAEAQVERNRMADHLGDLYEGYGE